MIDVFLAWLLTYWIHSTIALGCVWMASRWLRGRNLAVEEVAWKAALFVTLLTATAQLSMTNLGNWRPLAGSLEMRQIGAGVSSAAEVRNAAEVLSDLEIESRRGGAEKSTAVETLPERSVLVESSDFGGAPSANGRDEWIFEKLLSVWLAVTVALLLRLIVSYVVLLQNIRRRTRVSEGPHLQFLERLSSEAGVSRAVALSVCRALLVPLALGMRRWEVCLPSKVADEFGTEEQETVLAHELAHLVRRDTVWQFATRALAYALFVQPLNFVGAARLRTLAELRCDDWAVAKTGRPVTLAKCLTRVASWRTDRWGRLPLPAMASANRSQFGRRVRRLLSRSYPHPQAGVPRWLRLAAVPLVLAFVAAAPGAVGIPETPVAPAPAVIAGSEPAPTPTVSFAPPTDTIAPQLAAKLAPVRPANPAPAVPAPRLMPAPSIEPVPAPKPMPMAAPEVWGAPVPTPDATPSVPRTPMVALALPLAPSAASMGIPPVLATAPAPVRTSRVARLSSDEAGMHAGQPECDSDSDSEWDSDSESDEESGSDSELGSESHSYRYREDSHDDEMEALEDALDEEMDALEEELELEVEALEDDLDHQMELVEDATEEQFESIYDEFEGRFESDLEVLEDEIEELEERAEERFDRDGSRGQERAMERAVERLENELERFEDRHEDELERVAERFERNVGRLWERDVERELERAMEQQERVIERRLEAAEREMESAVRRYEVARDPETRERLLAELREQARLARPTEGELAEMRASMERIRSELAPRMDALQAAQEEFRHALEQWRGRYAADLKRLRENQRQVLGQYN